MANQIVLHISDLVFSWPRSTAPLLNIDLLSVAKGEKIFLHGPSGSGKSTLLNVIGGVLEPERGKIEVLGKNFSELTSSRKDQFRGDHMGFIFQMFNLLPYFSAVENVVLPCEFSKIKSKRVLEHATSLEEEAKRLLTELRLSVEDLSHKNVTKLSVGQQQRVATARAVMGRPEIIIADEPTSALDSNIRESFLKLLFEECHKFEITLIFVSHDISLGTKFDRVISLCEINKANMSGQMEREFI